jgi:hypothetical protein
MQPNTRDQIDDDQPEREGVQEVLGELQEAPRPVRASAADRVAEPMRHTGQIARDVYRD